MASGKNSSEEGLSQRAAVVFSAISLLTVKSSVTGNWLQFRRFCTLNNFIINIIDYLGWIFIFLQSLVLCQFMMKDYKVLKEK